MSDKPKFDPSQPFDPIEKPRFDPGAPFDEVTEPKMGWGEYLGRGATGALPVVGMASGAALGSAAAGPIGAVPAGAAGYAGGKEAEGILNHYLFNDEIPDTNPLRQAARVASNAGEGALYEMGGQGLAAGTKALAKPVIDTVGGALKTGAESLAENAPEMVGNAIRKGGQTFKLPFLTEKASGAIADRIAKPAEDLTRSVVNRFTGGAGESAAEGAATSTSSRGMDPFYGKARSNDPEALIPKTRGTKFEKPLSEAASRGDDAYRSMTFLLGQQYPEFRKLMSGGE